MLLSIVITTWNSRKVIEKCLDSLLPQIVEGESEVLVIDQGSTDGTLPYLKSLGQRIRLAWLDHYAPWTFANKTGIELSQGKWIALSNPDIYYPEGSVRKLVEAITQCDGGLVFGCHLVSPEGTSSKTLTSLPLNLASIIFVTSRCTIGKFLDRRILGRFFEKRLVQQPDRTCKVGHINASFMVVPRNIKLWEQRYRWTVADTDMLRRSGLPQVYLHDVTLVHEGQHSLETGGGSRHEYEYAYGWALYARLWRIRGVKLLLAMDAILTPFLVLSHGLRNQIVSSSAKIAGLVNA